MALQPASSQRFQLGPETSPGVGGTASNVLPTLYADLAPTGDAALVTRHAGGKEPGAVVMGDTWVAGNLGGGANNNIIDFNEAVFLAAANMNNPTATESPTGVWTRVFESDPDDVDDRVTYKIQTGTSSAPITVTNGMVPNMGFTLVRRGASTVQAAFMGKTLTPGGSFDSSTGVAQQSLASTKTGLYAPATFGSTLDTGHRLDPYGFSLEWHRNNVVAPHFVLDDSVIGPLGFLEGQVDVGGTIGIGYDVSGSDLAGPLTLAKMNAGTPIFISALNLGPNIPGTAVPYKFQLDLCIEISGPPTRQTVDNVIVYQWPFLCVADPTAGVSARLTLVTGLADSVTTP